MLEATPSPYPVPFDGSFRVSTAAAAPPSDVPDKATLRRELSESIDRLRDLQRTLYANDLKAPKPLGNPSTLTGPPGVSGEQEETR